MSENEISVCVLKFFYATLKDEYCVSCLCSNIADPKLPLKITVKDKDDTLGQIQIPLTDIPYEEHTFKWIALGPHRKNLNPTGEICIDCWIVEYSDVATPTRKDSNFFKFKHKFNLKQLSDIGRKGSIKYGGTSLKGSVSVEDLGAVTYRPTFSKTLERPKPSSNGLTRATSMFLKPDTNPSPRSERSPSLTELSPVAEKPSDPPEIRLITPISGPGSGGTLIRITGKYLGDSKRDIIALTVAGYDCLATLEYISSNKLMFTTPPGEGGGPVTLTTVAGGSCKSKVPFQFDKVPEGDSFQTNLQTADTEVPTARVVTPDSKKNNSRLLSFGRFNCLMHRTYS